MACSLPLRRVLDAAIRRHNGTSRSGTEAFYRSYALYLAGGMAVHLCTGQRVTTDIDAEFSARVAIPNDLVVEVVGEDGSCFQETHPTELFGECSVFREMLSNPAQLPALVHRAIRAAVGMNGVAVLVVPGDVMNARRTEGRGRRVAAAGEADRRPRPGRGFSLYRLRAAMSGRGDEVIDLARTNCRLLR